MAEYNFPIPGSKDEEEIVVFVRRHFVAFIGQFLLAFLLLIIPIIILIIIFLFSLELAVEPVTKFLPAMIKRPRLPTTDDVFLQLQLFHHVKP